jgi:hypothetical protein
MNPKLRNLLEFALFALVVSIIWVLVPYPTS